MLTVANPLYYFLQVLQMHFLTVCWNLIAYGSAFFTGYVRKVIIISVLWSLYLVILSNFIVSCLNSDWIIIIIIIILFI